MTRGSLGRRMLPRFAVFELGAENIASRSSAPAIVSSLHALSARNVQISQKMCQCSIIAFFAVPRRAACCGAILGCFVASFRKEVIAISSLRAPEIVDLRGKHSDSDDQRC